MPTSEVVVTALIAGIVSLLVSVIATWASIRSMTLRKRQHERELERRFTEKLYDTRLDSYPRAFSICGKLRSRAVFGDDFDSALASTVASALDDWNTSPAGMVISNEAQDAYHQLKDALHEVIKASGEVPKNLRHKVWDAKNQFLGRLRADLNLLYQEELVDRKASPRNG